MRLYELSSCRRSFASIFNPVRLQKLLFSDRDGWSVCRYWHKDWAQTNQRPILLIRRLLSLVGKRSSINNNCLISLETLREFPSHGSDSVVSNLLNYSFTNSRLPCAKWQVAWLSKCKSSSSKWSRRCVSVASRFDGWDQSHTSGALSRQTSAMIRVWQWHGKKKKIYGQQNVESLLEAQRFINCRRTARLFFPHFILYFLTKESCFFFSKLDLAAVGWLLSYVSGTELSSQPWAINLYFKSKRQ